MTTMTTWPKVVRVAAVKRTTGLGPRVEAVAAASEAPRMVHTFLSLEELR